MCKKIRATASDVARAPSSAGFENRFPGSEAVKVVAIVNWSGVTDVVDVDEAIRSYTTIREFLAKRGIAG